jgi:mannose-6-phosphate isomerase-like protein (cupin superfamily)
VRLRRVRTRRSIYSAVGGQWITSPRTGAQLKRDGLREEEVDGLAVVRVLKPDMKPFPAHVHLDFAERFEVVSGAAQAAIDGDKLRLTAGGQSVLYVPPGVPHVNPYNDERKDLELRQTFLPATEGAIAYVETLAAVLQDGRDDDGELPWPLILAVADVTGERSYLTPVVRKMPRSTTWSFALQRRVLLPAGKLLAGTRDFHVHLAPERDVSDSLAKKAAEASATRENP